MAKRSRGAARPGQRPTTRRPQQQQQRPPGRAGAAATDVARTARPVVDDAEELDSPLEAAPTSRSRSDRPVEREKTIVQPGGRSRTAVPSGLLAQRAAQEYGYVARDVRHIGVVGGGLFILLIVLFLLVEVVHVVTL